MLFRQRRMKLMSQAPSPKSPEGVVICSHGPETMWQLQWPSNLPWFNFSRVASLQVIQGKRILVDYLLRAGADINQKPAYHAGATALQFAAIKSYIGIARKLIDAGADVAAPRCAEHGRTALEGAAEWGRIDILQLLLNEGTFSEGLGRGQLIRAVKLAQLNGRFAAARLLKSTIEWSETDSECYEKEEFDEEEQKNRRQHGR